MMTRTTAPPYYVHRTPRGSVVLCNPHVVTDELKDEEADALAEALNNEFKRKNEE